MSQIVPLMKHNPSAQEPAILEAITVQREGLIADLVESVLDAREGFDPKLLVGPRGMGKTHLLSLVASRVGDDERGEPIVIAWLDEDPWAVRTYDKLVAAIAARVGKSLEDPELESRAKDLRSGNGTTWEEGEALLREALNGRKLLLLAENLDEIFRKIGPEGQSRFLAFATGWPDLLILATAPQPLGGIVEESSPLHDFFEVARLEELTVSSAVDLMRRIATLHEDQRLLEYLDEEPVERRFAAIEALAGGHPRIWILFAGCISVEAIDELVPLFIEALDDLTPYYQDRLRELGDQQQEIVVLLSEAGGALSNRDLAERSGIPQNQIATALRHLTERGYIRPAKVPADLGAGDNRMSFWELREPLMRLCLEVKQSRGEPLRMIVDFLRAWYGSDLLDELFRLPVEAELATTYASEAFRTLEGEVSLPNLFRGSSSEILARAELGLSLLPERSELLHARAAGLLGEGRFEEARDELDSLANAAPDGFIKTWLSAQLKIAKGALEEPVDLEALVADLQAIREETAHGPSTLDFVASILSLFGLEEEALAVFREGAALQPEDGRFQVGIGLTLRELGRDEEALEALARASELDPADASAHNHRGQALGALGRHEEALEAFTEAAELDPATAEFKVNLGVALGKLGRSDEALEALSQAIEIDAQDASAYGSRGLFLGGLGRHEEAAGDFAKAVELDPGNAIAHSNLGAALGRTGRYEEALATLTRAVGIEPTDATAHANRGTALQGLGRLEEACAAYEEAIALDPDDKFAPMGLGVALVALGHPTEALEAFDAALEHDPSYGRAHERRGSTLNNLGRFEEALDALDNALEFDPSRAQVWSNRGVVLSNLERFEEALEAFAKATDLDPEDASLQERRGFSLRSLGRMEEALAAFERTAELDPADADQQNNRANVLMALERPREAAEAARRAIALDAGASIFRFTLAEAALLCGDLEQFFPALGDALAIWEGEPKRGRPGQPDLLCQILWRRFRDDPRLPEAIAGIGTAYAGVEAVDELGRGVVSTVPLFVDSEISETQAEAWVGHWAAAPAGSELEIPLDILRAALAWKRDRDRAHLLALPSEQREILAGLLTR